MNDDRKKQLAEVGKRLSNEQLPITEDLKRAGVTATGVWEFQCSREWLEKRNQWVPVLIKHLGYEYDPRIKEGIARALAVPEAVAGWTTLLSEFRKALKDNREPPEAVAVSLAMALAQTTTRENIADLKSELLNENLGPPRVVLLSELKRLKRPGVLQFLEGLPIDLIAGRNSEDWLCSSS